MQISNIGQIELITQNQVVKLSKVIKSVLGTKLTKYKQVKQGMMQNLLPGRIRLV